MSNTPGALRQLDFEDPLNLMNPSFETGFFIDGQNM